MANFGSLYPTGMSNVWLDAQVIIIRLYVPLVTCNLFKVFLRPWSWALIDTSYFNRASFYFNILIDLVRDINHRWLCESRRSSSIYRWNMWLISICCIVGIWGPRLEMSGTILTMVGEAGGTRLCVRVCWVYFEWFGKLAEGK